MLEGIQEPFNMSFVNESSGVHCYVVETEAVHVFGQVDRFCARCDIVTPRNRTREIRKMEIGCVAH